MQSDLDSLGSQKGTGGPSEVLVAGTPGHLLNWTCNLLAAAMGGCHSSVAHIAIDGAARWIPPEPTANPAARLFIGNFINEDWAVSVKAGVIPAVLVVDDIPSAWDQLHQAGQSVGEVTRNLTMVATGLGDLVGVGRVLTLTRNAWEDPATLAARILDHVGLPCVPWRGRSLGREPGLFTQSHALVAPAFHYASTGIRTATVWPRECLFWGDRPGQPAPRVLDMTGPPRVIAYGPYFALPPGHWTVRATLAFSPASCGMPLTLELHGANLLGQVTFAAEQPGLFAASLKVIVPSPREPLEIRLRTERGAIKGNVGVDRIDIVPVL